MVLLIIGVIVAAGILYALLVRRWDLMTALFLSAILIVALSVFGINMYMDEMATEAASIIDTTQPVPSQIEHCRHEMRIDPAAVIHPLGYHFEPRGQDKLLLCKFRTADLGHLFEAGVVDLEQLEIRRFAGLPLQISPVWWDVEVQGQDMRTARYQLPPAAEMAVGVTGSENNYVVYVQWFNY